MTSRVRRESYGGKNLGFNKGKRRRSGIDGRRALMRTYSRGWRDKHEGQREQGRLSLS